MNSGEKLSRVPAGRRLSAPAIRCCVPRPRLAAVTAAVTSLLADGCISICTVRAFLVLAAVPEDGSADGLSELAAQVGLPIETVHRFLLTLTALGLVEQPDEARCYRRTRVCLADCLAELP